jgi:hypothetical protein
LISTAAAIGGDEDDENRRIRRRGRQIGVDARDGAAAARATAPATERRWTGERKGERIGGRAYFFR